MRNRRCIIRSVIVLVASLLLLFAGYACDTPTAPGGCNGNSGNGNSGSYDTYSEGPYTVTQSLSSGPSGDSGVFYPRSISSEPGPFPVLVFGCGAGTRPRAYTDHGNMIASHGFIVIINASDNQGRMNTNSINWIIQQNSNSRSDFYGKVATDKIAAGGHSQGSIGTFAMADDPRLTTTIHVAGGSFDGNGPRSLRHPAIYISGTGDMALSNCERDYRNTGNVPVFFTVQQGVDHVAAAREGLPVIIAWMRWQLYGETDRADDFLNRNAEFTTGKWDSQYKNW